jgi:hypothetical protein
MRQRLEHALLQRGVGACEEVQREVHAIGMYPRRFRMLVNGIVQIGRDTLYLRTRRVININRDEKSFPQAPAFALCATARQAAPAATAAPCRVPPATPEI